MLSGSRKAWLVQAGGGVVMARAGPRAPVPHPHPQHCGVCVLWGPEQGL